MERVNSGSDSGDWLNYHHVLKFRAIARAGGVTKAAGILRVSPSALSEQVRELEEWLGAPLFERRGRGLVLTDAGRMALEHAEAIHQSGAELLGAFRRPGLATQRVLRIGAVGTLSKNLQFDFIEPLLERRDCMMSVAAGGFEDLLARLRSHALDVVLSHAPAPPGGTPEVFNHALGEVPAFLLGRLRSLDVSAGFPAFLRGVPLFLPSRGTPLREDFDLLLAEAGIVPDVRAEVDDMALLRLLALSGKGLALASAVVVKREIKAAELLQVVPTPGLYVRFYAVTVRRKLANPWLGEVVSGFRERLRQLDVAVQGMSQRWSHPKGMKPKRGATRRGAGAQIHA